MHHRNRGGQRGSTILQRMVAVAAAGILAAVAFARCSEAAGPAGPVPGARAAATAAGPHAVPRPRPGADPPRVSD